MATERTETPSIAGIMAGPKGGFQARLLVGSLVAAAGPSFGVGLPGCFDRSSAGSNWCCLFSGRTNSGELFDRWDPANLGCRQRKGAALLRASRAVVVHSHFAGW